MLVNSALCCVWILVHFCKYLVIHISWNANWYLKALIYYVNQACDVFMNLRKHFSAVIQLFLICYLVYKCNFCIIIVYLLVPEFPLFYKYRISERSRAPKIWQINPLYQYVHWLSNHMVLFIYWLTQQLWKCIMLLKSLCCKTSICNRFAGAWLVYIYHINFKS